MQSSLTTLKHYIATQKQQEPMVVKQAYASEQQNKLHGAIKINAAQPADALLLFISEYIDSVPDYIHGLHCLAEETGISDYIQPLLILSCSYFVAPPDIIQDYSGLQGLLHSAYLAHRLIEEMNDQVMNVCGAPLAKMDMSMANIVCHSMIGDELANQLDHLVLLTIETTTASKDTLKREAVKKHMQQRQFKGWEDVLQQWPCFAKDYAIHLQLGHSSLH